MAFGLYEYPHTDFYDSDLSELLKFNKILVDNYNEIVAQIRAAQKKYDDAFRYIANRNNWFAKQTEDVKKVFIQCTEALRRAADETVNKITNQMNRINEFIAALKEMEENTRESNSALVDKLGEQGADYRKQLQQMMDETIRLEQETYKKLNKDIGDNFTNIGNMLTALLNAFTERVNANTDSNTALVDDFRKAYDDAIDAYEDKLSWWTKEEQTLRQEELEEIEREFNMRMAAHEVEVNEIMKRVAELKIEIVRQEMKWRNPVNGKTENLQKILNKMWRWTTAWSLTVEQWENLPYTVEEIEEFLQNPTRIWEKGLTVEDGEVLSRWILVEKPDLIERAQSVRLDLETYKDELFKQVEDEWEPRFWLATASIQQNCMVYIDYLHEEHVKETEERLDELRNLVADDFSAKVADVLEKQASDWDKLLEVTKMLAERSLSGRN